MHVIYFFSSHFDTFCFAALAWAFKQKAFWVSAKGRLCKDRREKTREATVHPFLFNILISINRSINHVGIELLGQLKGKFEDF